VLFVGIDSESLLRYCMGALIRHSWIHYTVCWILR